MTRPNAVRALAAAVLLATGLGATGCGSEGTPSAAAPRDPATTSSTGSPTVSQDLPAGFPKGDVPLLDGKVISAVKGTGGSPVAGSVVLQTSRPVEVVTAEVEKDFARAGYRKGQSDVMGDVSVSHFHSARYDVGVTAARTGGTISVTYLVRNHR